MRLRSNKGVITFLAVITMVGLLIFLGFFILPSFVDNFAEMVNV